MLIHSLDNIRLGDGSVETELNFEEDLLEQIFEAFKDTDDLPPIVDSNYMNLILYLEQGGRPVEPEECEDAYEIFVDTDLTSKGHMYTSLYKIYGDDIPIGISYVILTDEMQEEANNGSAEILKNLYGLECFESDEIFTDHLITLLDNNYLDAFKTFCIEEYVHLFDEGFTKYLIIVQPEEVIREVLLLLEDRVNFNYSGLLFLHGREELAREMIFNNEISLTKRDTEQQCGVHHSIVNIIMADELGCTEIIEKFIADGGNFATIFKEMSDMDFFYYAYYEKEEYYMILELVIKYGQGIEDPENVIVKTLDGLINGYSVNFDLIWNTLKSKITMTYPFYYKLIKICRDNEEFDSSHASFIQKIMTDHKEFAVNLYDDIEEWSKDSDKIDIIFDTCRFIWENAESYIKYFQDRLVKENYQLIINFIKYDSNPYWNMFLNHALPFEFYKDLINKHSNDTLWINSNLKDVIIQDRHIKKRTRNKIKEMLKTLSIDTEI